MKDNSYEYKLNKIRIHDLKNLDIRSLVKKEKKLINKSNYETSLKQNFFFLLCLQFLIIRRTLQFVKPNLLSTHVVVVKEVCRQARPLATKCTERRLTDRCVQRSTHSLVPSEQRQYVA